MRERMEAISATARVHHTSCRRCPYWTADGYRSDTQGLPPRYADRGSADESRERGDWSGLPSRAATCPFLSIALVRDRADGRPLEKSTISSAYKGSSSASLTS